MDAVIYAVYHVYQRKKSCILYFLFPESLCKVPVHFHGDFFSIEQGDERNTLINEDRLTNDVFDGQCHDMKVKNETIDAEGRFDTWMLFNDE